MVIGDLYGGGGMANKLINHASYLPCQKLILYEFEMNHKIQPALSYFANSINAQRGKVEVRPVFDKLSNFARRSSLPLKELFDLLWLDYCKELTEANGYEESAEEDLRLFSKLMKDKSTLAITSRLIRSSKSGASQSNSFMSEKIKKYYPSANLLYNPKSLSYVNNNSTYAVYFYELNPRYLILNK